MATDPDQTGFWTNVFATLGGGAGVTALFRQMMGQSGVLNRIKQLEDDRIASAARFVRHNEKLDGVIENVNKVAVSVGRLDGKVDSLITSVETNRNLYIARRKQHIHDTGGEIDE